MIVKDLAFWVAVGLVSIAASVLMKIIGAHSPVKSVQEFAAAS